MPLDDTRKKDRIKVSILFTESTSSLLQLTLPYLEDLHRSDSKICVISNSETNYKRPITCKADIKYRNKFKEWDSKVTSDVVFFATNLDSSITLFDDLSERNLNESGPNSISNIPNSLQPVTVYTRPFVTVRSMAHADNLQVDSNRILVSLLDDEEQLHADVICRICHGGDSIDDLLTPCRCRGTVALAHLVCLERWLRESAHSYCELCQHHYQIVREPKYSVPWSICVFLRHPGNHTRELLMDVFAFICYTPSAVISNYLLLLLCETIAKANLDLKRSLSTHILAFTALLGIAVIDFSYTSWFFNALEKHIDAWREWYRSNCKLKLILPRRKLRPYRLKKKEECPDFTSQLQENNTR